MSDLDDGSFPLGVALEVYLSTMINYRMYSTGDGEDIRWPCRSIDRTCVTLGPFNLRSGIGVAIAIGRIGLSYFISMYIFRIMETKSHL